MSKRLPKSSKTCAVCGKAFPCFSSDKTVTCSKECSRIHRSLVHKGVSNSWADEKRKNLRWNQENLKKGTLAAQRSPKSGRFESNINAVDWHLIDPHGKHYTFRNLNYWAEHNYFLFGFTDPKDWYKVAKGIRTAKRGAQGKISASTYKDWSIVID